ncbi:cysteine-rich KTR domain-containing protein [uncultured Oscillibacter sp.]|uniref:cysteine-rich KTR domain-containing protein n=1 Tax=uncultured Oscillibacter sp. TaxID=876091 RepID=UPI003421CB38
MQSAAKPAKLAVKNGYVVCPTCRHRTNQHITPGTEARRLELWCHRCKATHVVSITNGQCYLDCPRR